MVPMIDFANQGDLTYYAPAAIGSVSVAPAVHWCGVTGIARSMTLGPGFAAACMLCRTLTARTL